jgi:hypothetical protein
LATSSNRFADIVLAQTEVAKNNIADTVITLLI